MLTVPLRPLFASAKLLFLPLFRNLVHGMYVCQGASGEPGVFAVRYFACYLFITSRVSFKPTWQKKTGPRLDNVQCSILFFGLSIEVFISTK